MKTDKQKRSEAIQKYLNDSLNLEDYNQANSWTNFMTNFNKEYGFMIERIGQHNAIKEYLQGLPTSLNIVYTYYDIINLCYDQFNYKVTRLSTFEGKTTKDYIKPTAESANSFYWEALAKNIIILYNKEVNGIIEDYKIIKL